MCSYIKSFVNVCRIISFLKGFTLFYHIPHTYGMHVAGNLIEIKNGKGEACLEQGQNTFNYFETIVKM